MKRFGLLLLIVFLVFLGGCIQDTDKKLFIEQLSIDENWQGDANKIAIMNPDENKIIFTTRIDGNIEFRGTIDTNRLNIADYNKTGYIFAYYDNNSGIDANKGNIVILAAKGNSFTFTTIEGTQPLGILAEDIKVGQKGKVAIHGIIDANATIGGLGTGNLFGTSLTKGLGASVSGDGYYFLGIVTNGKVPGQGSVQILIDRGMFVYNIPL